MNKKQGAVADGMSTALKNKDEIDARKGTNLVLVAVELA